MSQDRRLTVDELIRKCGDLRWVYELRNQDTLRTASEQPINEATVYARGREFMARDAEPTKALHAAIERPGQSSGDEPVMNAVPMGRGGSLLE